jgi:hypothetical protein
LQPALALSTREVVLAVAPPAWSLTGRPQLAEFTRKMTVIVVLIARHRSAAKERISVCAIDDLGMMPLLAFSAGGHGG